MVLQRLRKSASGFVAKGFLAILTLSFVVWGIADVFRTYGTTAVATVAGTDIPADAFRQQFLDQIQRISRQVGRPITPEQARAFGLDRQVLDRMITEAVLDAEVHRRGLAVSDTEVARLIRENPAFRRPGAQAFEPAYFEQLLRANNLTEQRFIALERREILRRQLVDSLGGGIAAPAVLTEMIHRHETEQRDIAFLLMGPSAIGTLPEPTQDQLRAFYDDHKITFRAPELRSFIYLTLTPAALAPWIQVSDEDLKAAYEVNAARLGTPERRTVQQIVVPTEQDAQDVAEKLKAGASFADIAASRNLSEKDISIGTVAQSDLIDPKVAQAAFALPEGGTSALIAGQFGAALVHVTKIEPAVRVPFEQVADQLRKDIALERARRELLDKHDAVEDERSGGASLAEVAQKLGLNLETVDQVDRSGRDAAGAPMVEGPGHAELMAGVFSSPVGVETDPVQLPQGAGFLWYEVKSITPARERAFDEVKDQVRSRWVEAETAKAVAAKADSVLAELKAGKSLADVAAAANLEVKTLKALQRGRNVTDLAPPALEAIFEAKPNGFGTGPGTGDTERILFQVTNVEVPQLAPSETQMAGQIGQQIESDVLMQFVAQLRQELGVTINARAFQLAVGGN